MAVLGSRGGGNMDYVRIGLGVIAIIFVALIIGTVILVLLPLMILMMLVAL